MPSTPSRTASARRHAPVDPWAFVADPALRDRLHHRCSQVPHRLPTV